VFVRWEVATLRWYCQLSNQSQGCGVYPRWYHHTILSIGKPLSMMWLVSTLLRWHHRFCEVSVLLFRPFFVGGRKCENGTGPQHRNKLNPILVCEYPYFFCTPLLGVIIILLEQPLLLYHTTMLCRGRLLLGLTKGYESLHH
jgi:hypothetical protein